jgi:glycosyltransferase involved in cell wall biosynthesis
MLSIVVPCYNEASCIDAFLEAVRAINPNGGDYEVIFVDDGSTDDTLKLIRENAGVSGNVHYMSFSRNFGKESALIAGLKKATGDLVVTMDVDLQDPPSYLPKMLDGIAEGFDCVATRRSTRAGEPPIRSWFARRFYWLMRHFSDVELVDGARDYRMMTRKVVNAIISMPENNRFTKGIYQWVGFRTKWISYENVERCSGETKWSFWKLFKYSIDGILAFTTAPLQIASWIGLLSCLGSFSYLCWIFFRVMIWGDPVAGWPSMICIIVFLGGIQLMMVGILGAYLSKVYLETKRRPMYIVSEEG